MYMYILLTTDGALNTSSCLYLVYCIVFSRACGIKEDNHVIVTGGMTTDKVGRYVTVSTVSVYGEDGWKYDLKNFTDARLGHGCSSFLSGGQNVFLVKLFSNFKKIFLDLSCCWGL